MSGAMLKQMMEEASAFLKNGQYEKALDAARRVSQFSASNFPALMCVGVASLHLQLYEDAETALRRAADLKPELPVPWKHLVDLYDATGDAAKKIEVLEKLIGVFRSGNKVKPSQKWIAELATTATSLKMYGTAFDAWYTLVDEQQGLSVDTEPNEELPSSLVIWLTLIDLIQLPAFALSDAKSSGVSMETLEAQFSVVARRWNWADTSPETENLRGKTDVALAMFFRHQLNQVKTAKGDKTKQTELKKLDTLTCSLMEWFPASKLAAEYLLLRSEDGDSPIDNDRAIAIASTLGEKFPKSALGLMFQGFSILESEPHKARDLIAEGLANCSASSFHEGSLCVRAQMELALAALKARDVESCLARLRKAQEVAAEKVNLLGSAALKPSVYSDVKLQLLRAQAHDLAGAFEASLEAYQDVITSARGAGDADSMVAASIGAGELLCSKNRPEEALKFMDEAEQQSDMANDQLASLKCSIAWAKYLLDDKETSKTLILENHPKLLSNLERARALKRLAIVYWYLGEPFRSDKAACFGSLLQAAKLAPSDGEVFAWLGTWYKEVANDIVRAEKCFLKALTLAPLNEMAGVALSQVYEQQGKNELNVKLWQNLTSAPESAPTWALLRLAQYLVDQDDEEAVSKLHLVLRNDPLSTTYWVAMGHVYRHFGKLVAAQRSYLRAIELGETGWCVLVELARIEGSLHQFDDAIVRIEQASDDTREAPKDVISTVHAELLYEQAKYFNGEGLYGRAAANIKKASALLELVTNEIAAVPALKLLGDIHSFAFYLSPLDFASEGWVDFIALGRKAYTQVISAVPKDSSVSLAQAHYDIGVNCWYQARALYSIRGKHFNAFALHNDEGSVRESVQYFEDARFHLRKALEYDEAFSLAWNALGVVLKHPLAKQFAWTRAIQSSNIDAAWANLGMLYVHQRCDDSRAADLARNAFLHLQSVNTNNPAMWIGYGMIYLSQKNRKDHRKAREAFLCALEMGNHLDALQGVVLSTIISLHDAIGEEKDEMPSFEFLLFAIKKYLERESEDPLAWMLLSTVQSKLGHFNQAVAASSKCEQDLESSTNERAARNRAIITAVKLVNSHGDPNEAFNDILKVFSGKSVGRHALEAQRLYFASNGLGALTSARAALESVSTKPSEQQGAIASFVLALCALVVPAHNAEALSLAESALAVVTERITAGTVSAQELQAVEAFHRAIGSLNKFIYLIGLEPEAGSKTVVSLLDTHRNLALVDVCDPAALTSRKRDPVVIGDALWMSSLKSLLAGDAALQTGEKSSPMKLVRAEPWNPDSYTHAAMRMYKSALLDESADEETRLRGALRLLETGLRIAKDQEGDAILSTLLIHWVCALVHQRLGKDSEVKMHCDKALERLSVLDGIPLIEKLVWEARINAFVDHAAAIAKYSEALKTASSGPSAKQPTVVLAILYELGGMCESAGLLDPAHHVWKTVMSWKSPTSRETDAFNTTGFLGNLHLALVHAAKQNAKSAKKFSKTAVTLATAGETDGDANTSVMATTARFVESVIAKM